MQIPCSGSPTIACVPYDRINVIVAGKQPSPQWLAMNEAITHCEAGISIWKWAEHRGAEFRA